MADPSGAAPSAGPFVLPGPDLAPSLAGRLRRRREDVVIEDDVEGPPGLVPPDGATIRSLLIESPAGHYHVHSMHPFSPDPEAVAAAFPDRDEVDVSGVPGWLTHEDLRWTLMWARGPEVTLGVVSFELGPDEVVAVARSLRHVSEDQWRSVPVEAPDTVPEWRVPGARRRWTSVDDPVVAGSGAQWTVWAQVVRPHRGAPSNEPHLCVWLESGAGGRVDWGCGTAGGMLAPQLVDDEWIVPWLVSPTAHRVEIRTGAEPVVAVDVVRPHPESPRHLAVLVIAHDAPDTFVATFDERGGPLEPWSRLRLPPAARKGTNPAGESGMMMR